MKGFRSIGLTIVVSAFAIVSGCGFGRPGSGQSPSRDVVLKGAGTSNAEIFRTWFQAYSAADNRVKLEYQVSSGENPLQRLAAGELDFVVLESGPSPADLAKIQPQPRFFIAYPDAVVLVYNLPNGPKLNFAGETLAKIFSGKDKAWNHSDLELDNPGVKLPAEEILPIHRSDPNLSTAVFTELLSIQSRTWSEQMGRGSTIMWPGGQQVAGAQAMAEAVAKTPYSIGYMELHEALQAKLAVGAVQNAGDNFAPATVAAVSTSADGTEIGGAPRFTIVNAEGRMAHPMCVVKWIAVPAAIRDADKRKATAGFLQWLYSEGQRQLTSLGYAALPAGWLTKMQAEVAKIR